MTFGYASPARYARMRRKTPRLCTAMKTSILPVDDRRIGRVVAAGDRHDILDHLSIEMDPKSPDAERLRGAAQALKSSDVPVAFPTETVYGLGADATRSAAVQGIYKAKQRPADNPLIVHFASLRQLRDLLRPVQEEPGAMARDPIPEIYHPLITKFWPGPLTIILPNPKESPLAPEVTAGLKTFGARMPKNLIALALINLANVPVAAPSANASTKPSPTAAEHVAHDLDGRIETIVDGGPCDVGVESTVVDGLSDPPSILRPGGISLQQLRSCRGWERTQIAYRDVSQRGSHQPRAPGMKYRHYSPQATVVLHEAGSPPPTIPGGILAGLKIGVVTTKWWKVCGHGADAIQAPEQRMVTNGHVSAAMSTGFRGMLECLHAQPCPRSIMKHHVLAIDATQTHVWEIALGRDTADIARGVFSALRELDREGVDRIFVEGIDDAEGDTAAAVMNRLRKAAEHNLQP